MVDDHAAVQAVMLLHLLAAAAVLVSVFLLVTRFVVSAFRRNVHGHGSRG